ncbi:hypothetical protein NEOLEDRAFT_1140245, partial [Neolentinus lepideus HHB14362 ss-1]
MAATVCSYRPAPSSWPRNQLLTKHAGHTATSTENKGADVVQRGCGLFSLAIDTRITSIFC